MRVKQIATDIEELKMHLSGGHIDRAEVKLEAMSDTYTSIPERDRIRGELLRARIAIPECFGASSLAGFTKRLNDRL